MQITGSSSIEKTLLEASDAIKKSIDDSTELADEDKEKAKSAIDKTTFIAIEIPNTLVYRIAVGSIALLALLIVFGSLVLVGLGREVPTFIQMALATAIGALAGMIVPSGKTSS